MDETSTPPGSGPLNGWKEIAAYLGRSVRAVQRYESELGLPVHRLRSADGQSVYAFREEIDEWRRHVDMAHPPRPSTDPGPGALPDTHASATIPAPAPATGGAAEAQAQSGRIRSLTWGLGAIILAVALGAVVRSMLLRSDPEAIVSVRWAGDAIEVLDSERGTLWSHRFNQPVIPPESVEHRIVDLNADGRSDLLLPVRFAEPGPTIGSAARSLTSSDALYAFSHDGKILWRAAPDLVLSCGTNMFSAPWQLKAMALSSGSLPRIWLSFAHHTWWPAFLLELLPDGRATLRYVQPGWVLSLTEWTTPGGRFLVAGGVLNEYNRASVALIDLDGPPARTPSERPAFACGNLSEQGLRRLYLLPRLETTVLPQSYEWVDSVRTVGPDLKASYESRHAILRISADLRVADYGVSDSYLAKHRELEGAGTLDHTGDECPFVTQGQEIREWSVVTGWQTVTVHPVAR